MHSRKNRHLERRRRLRLRRAQRSSRRFVDPYTDTATFLNDVQPGYYLETFDGETTLKNLGTILSFSSNGYSYTGTASGGYAFGNGEFYGSYENFGSNPVLSVTQQGTQIEFDFASNISAVGGTFFMQDNSQMVTDGAMTLDLADGTNLTINSGTPFTVSPVPRRSSV